jgi:uncharacterized protein (TIGR00106 family)
MPIMEISIIPLGTKSPSVSTYVASCVNVLNRDKKVRYQLTSMGTIVESKNVSALLTIAKKMHNSVFSKEVQRVVTTIKIDDRKDRTLSIEGKVQAVRRKLKKRNTR